jgi:uncharacterized membrane protein YgdD (TMEM256/DUF423 family)
MTTRFTFICAGISGALAVALGAFGAHALKPMLMASGKLEAYQTAVAYHFYHTLALFVLGLLMRLTSMKILSYIGLCFLAGILLFSGSLYLMAITGVSGIGFVTPFGGLFFIAGWLLIVVGAVKK